MSTEYYPSLFNRAEPEKKETKKVPKKEEKKTKVPLKTLYDSPLIPVEQPNINYTTIFGTTNLELLRQKIKECGEVKEQKSGQNYISVDFVEPESVQKLLKMDKKIFNGEMVGVYTNKTVIEKEDVIIRKRGIFTWIVEYLIGN